MKFILNKIRVETVLRLSLGAMYVYSGWDIFKHPSSWYWAVRQLPDNVEKIVTAFGIDRFIMAQGILELAMAAVFILWFIPKFWVKFFAIFSSLEMLAILFLVGVDRITFRDIGLIGVGLAIYLLVRKR